MVNPPLKIPLMCMHPCLLPFSDKTYLNFELHEKSFNQQCFLDWQRLTMIEQDWWYLCIKYTLIDSIDLLEMK